MDNPSQESKSPQQHTSVPPIRKKPRGTLFFIGTTMGIAVVIATLFTAWTDPGIVPGALGNKVTINYPSLTKLPQNLASTTTPRSNMVIGIVPGHSGYDSGAVCTDGLTELKINQQIATYIQKYLTENHIEVDLLNEFDDRLEGYNALTLISIHADSCDYINDQATGFKVAASLSNPHPERSARLVACLRNRYAQATGLALHNSITNDMTYYHAFDEINSETTAAIIEVGFMNLDRQLLTEHPDTVARGIVNGILCFIYNENISPPSTP